MFCIQTVNLYYKIGQSGKGNKLAEDFAHIVTDELTYYLSMNQKFRNIVDYEIKVSFQILQSLSSVAKQYNQTDLASKFEKAYNDAAISYNSQRK